MQPSVHNMSGVAAVVAMRLTGIMGCLLQDLNKESKRIARYRARMEQVDKWMSRRHLPKSLRSRIGHHYQEVRLRFTICLVCRIVDLKEILPSLHICRFRAC